MGPATVIIDLKAFKLHPRNIQIIQGQPVYFKNSNPESAASTVCMSFVFVGADSEAESAACGRSSLESENDAEWMLEKLPSGTECATWIPNKNGK
jgi:hypothetical protein